MSEYDREDAKKLAEEADLALFLTAYKQATGETFTEVTPSETPDFIANDLLGHSVGIELTRLKFDPDYMFWQRYIERRDMARDDDAFWRILGLIAAKSAKLASGRWPSCQRKLLVIQLVDYPLEQLVGITDTEKPSPGDFTEIWLADYSIVDMFGGVDLLPVVHPELEGPYLVASTGKKPWG